MPPPKDPERYKEYIRRVSGVNNPMYGKHASEETRKKMSVSHKGKFQTLETRKRMSELHKGKHDNRGNKNPMWGRQHSENTRKKISKNHANMKGENNPMYGKKRSFNEVTLKKLSEANRLEKNPAWKGGVAFEPYCPKFNFKFKERVRDKQGRKCLICGKTEKENGERLSVHHVNYDKMVCCNGKKPLFAALCHSCHTHTTNHREYWEEILTVYLLLEFDGETF